MGAMRKIALAVIVWTVAAFCQTTVRESEWIEAKSAHYSVFYQPGLEDDVRFTRTWLDRAEELLKDKYALLSGRRRQL